MSSSNTENNATTFFCLCQDKLIILQDKRIVSLGNKADAGAGVYVTVGRLTMSGGSIRSNMAKYVGGGVLVNTGASFIQSGGSVSGNAAQRAGGVYVEKGATYTRRGGSVSGNTAIQNNDVYQE
jgi:hypothetical protein